MTRPAISFAVGFIGIGHMGSAMAQRLSRTGHDVVVYDRRPEAVAECVAAGARSVDSFAGLPAECEICLVCVTDAPQVRDVVSELLDGASNSAALRMIVVHSTITPELALELDQQASHLGVRVIDAPVSGNLEARANGSLAMMIGATDDELEPYREVFTTLSGGYVVAGRRGAGAALKLINNVLSLIQVLSLAEALAMADAYWIDNETFRAAITAASGDSYAVRNMEYFQRFPEGHPLGHDEGFYEFMRKDLFSAIDSAAATGLRLPFVSVAAAVAPDVYRNFWKIGKRTKGKK